MFDEFDAPPGTDILDALGIEASAGWPDRFGVELRTWAARKWSPISALSLFSGGGGLDIGFHDAGFAAHSMVEIDDRHIKTLVANSGDPDTPLGGAQPLCLDIGEFDSKSLPRIDFIIGGPPCQTFSAAGRRAHGVQGTDDPRGVLFLEYVRLLRELQPTGFLFENVYGIVGAQKGQPWRRIVEGFEDCGYTLSYRILDSADFGVPQHRERLIIVGSKDRAFRFPRPLFGPDSSSGRTHFTAGEALADLTNGPLDVDGPTAVGGRYGHLLAEVPPGLNYSYFTERMGHPRPVFAWRSKFSDFLYKADPQSPVRTIKARGGQYTGPFHWENRPFTTRELKRLQTFPDDYSLIGGRATQIEQIGNSVPPQLARILAAAVRESIFGDELPGELAYLDAAEVLSFRSLKRERSVVYESVAREHSAREGASLHKLERAHFRASLNSGFELEQSPDGVLEITVSANPADTWSVVAADHSAHRPGGPFQIEVGAARHVSWMIPARRVVLSGPSLTRAAFTAAWKAFERVLAQAGLKADLVQLNGYYQYKPRITATMQHDHGAAMWDVVSAVVGGHGVGTTSSLETLGFTWGVASEAVVGHCLALRELGYEVRNHSTNPQIPEGVFLIPYAFPTLNARSVQLGKSL